MSKRAVTVGVVALLIVSSFSAPASAAFSGIPSAQPANLEPASSHDNEVGTGLENLSVWDRAIFPLRANVSEATTQVPLPEELWFTDSGEIIDANRDRVGVFDPGTVPLEYNTQGIDGPDNTYAGENVTVVVGEANTTVSQLRNILSLSGLDQQSFQELNDEVEFEAVSTQQLDGEGELPTINYDATSGEYVTLVGTVGNTTDPTFTVQNGDIVLHDETTVVGAEPFVVQDSPSSVTPPSTLEPGANATFDIDTDLDGSAVDHGVVLYDEGTLTSSYVELNATEPIDANFTTDDILVEHSIETVDGIASIENGTELFGANPDAIEESGPQPVTDIVDFIAQEADLDSIDTTAIGDTILNASVRGVSDRSADTSVTVETLDRWEETDYRWLHVAANDSDVIATNTGTLSLETPGSISGVVTDDETGAPISGATVELDETGQTVTTNASGGYALANVSPGTYTLSATQSGYEATTVSSVDVTAGDQTTQNISLSPIDQVESFVSVWDRSPLPLRANLSAASTVVDNADLFLRNADGNLVNANREQLGVFNSSSIPMSVSTLDVDGVDGTDATYADKNVTLIVGESNTTLSQARDMASIAGLDQETLEDLNAEMDFETVSLPQNATLDSQGEMDGITYDAGPGEYVAVMATVGDASDPAMDVDANGNITVTDNTTIIGVDGFAVQNGPSTVTAPSTVGVGANATFSVDSGLAGSAIDHGVVLYNESKLTESYAELNVTAPIDENLSLEDVILEHEIATVSGVQSIEDGVDIFGTSPDNQSVVGPTAVSDVIAFFASEADVDGIQHKTLGTTNLNASVTAVANRSASTTVTVETLGNWSTGEYRWIHAAANESDVVATDTDTVTVEETGTIAGTVTNESGGALENTTVEIEETGQTTTTNATGQYELTDVSPGTVNVTTSQEGYENETATVSVLAGGTAEQDFTLSPVDQIAQHVSVWDRAPFPLRANLSAATTVIDNANLFVRNHEGTTVDANRDRLGVFDPGTIPLNVSTLGVNGPDGTYANENVTLIVGESNTTLSQARDIASIAGMNEETLADLNDEMDFETVNLSQQALDGDGEMDGITYDATPGEYVAVMATVGDATDRAIDVDGDGNISVTDDTTIIGAEGFAVQNGASTVTAPSTVGVGENATFSVDSDLTGSAIDHGVVLYNESKLTDSQIDINVTAPIDENLSIEDVILEHEITTLSGVQSIESGVDIFGASPDDQRVVGPTAVSDVIAFLASEADVDGVQSTPLGPTTVLNASVTALANRTAATAVTVETLGNWSTGEYRWIHASANETDVVATDTGTLSVEETGAIAGTVTNESGDILENATVEVEETGQTVTTNATGQYELADVSPGTVNVTATQAGYENETTPVNVTPGATVTQNFTLAPRLETLDLTLANASLFVNETTTATVTATYGNGSVVDVTNGSTITSNDTAVAMVSNGTVTANDTGQANVTAAYENATDTAVLTVTESAPEPLPALFYGSIAVDDMPADSGTVIESEVNGTVRGSITLNESGHYGGAGVGDSKLEVSGQPGDDNATITFYVNGSDFDRTQTNETATWQAGDTFEQNLTATTPPATIEGTVTNTTGSAVTNATVAAGNQSTQTNATGDYTLSVVRGTYNLTATAPGYTNLSEQVNVTANETVTRDITLSRITGSITGSVTNSSGDPLGNATVSIDGTGQTTQTAANGTYTIDDLVPGSYTVTASQAGYENETEPVTVQPETTAQQNFTLSPRLDAIDLTLANTTLFVNETTTATVNATYGNGSTIDVTDAASITSNDTAVATVSNATITAGDDGQVDIIASFGNETNTTILTVTNQFPEPIPASYFGSIEIDGTPADTDVSIEAEVNGTVRGSITVNTTGSYGGPGTGDSKLEVTGNESTSGAVVEFYVNGSDFERTLANETVTWTEGGLQQVNLTATTPPATLEGTVADPAGAPIANATITTGAGTAVTSPAGTYNLSVPRGTHNVTANATGYAPTDTTLTVASNETRPANFTLTPRNGSISGTVTSTQTGDPIESASVTLDSGQSATTDATGNYSIANVSPGTYNLTAAHANFTANSTAVTVGPDESVTQAISLPPVDLAAPNVTVWDRAPLPLRANLSAASTVVDNANLFLQNADGNLVNANRDRLGVFDAGTVPLNVSTQVDVVDDTYANENVTLIVGESNTTLSQARDVASIAGMNEETLADLNDEMDFETVNLSQQALDGDGEMDGITYDADPGEYVAVMATVGDATDPAIDVDGDGNITVTDDTTVIGLEGFAVQAGPSNVTAPSTLGAGANATFTVDSELAGSAIDHGIVLYNEATLTNSEVRLNVTAPFDENLSIEDIILEHEIATVSGVQSIEGGVDIFGASPDNQSVVGPTAVSDVVAFLASEADVEGIQHTPIGPTVLNASATAVADRSAVTNVTVETLGNWSAGEYRWIHAAANETDVVTTDTGTLTIEQSGTIAGTVTNESGDALSNATVEIEATGQTATTNATGQYELPDVDPGTYNVTATQAGYENGTAPVDVTPGETVTQNFTLAPRLEIDLALDNHSLTVNETTSATVTATYGNGSSINVTDAATITSNDTAVATVSNGTVTANGTGQVAINAEYENTTATTVLTVTAAPPQPLPAMFHGTISVDNMSAAPGTVIEAEINGTVRGSITLNDSGQYGGDGAGDPRLEVSGDPGDAGETITFYVNGSDFDRTQTTETATWQAGTTTEQNLTATTPPATIEGAVTNTTGSVLSNATVAVGNQSTLTNATGYYNLSVVRGTHNLTATAPDYTNSSEQVTVAANETATRNITLVPVNGSITGSVVDSTGDPLGNATISITETGQTAQTAANGTYTIDDVVPGSYTVTASQAGYEPETTPVNVTPGATVTQNFTLEPSLAAINLTLADATLILNETTTATVTATYANGSVVDVTDAATITSNDTAVATVSNGTVTANGTGQVAINADHGNTNDTAVLTVTPAPPEPVPALFHGSIIVDGMPAAPGTVIEAEIGGEVRGSITLNDTGQYGDTGVGDPKLEVSGEPGDAGETITFYVNGSDFDRTQATETATWQEGATVEQNLTATTPPATIEGTVTDTAGSAIANATVTAGNQSTQTTATGAYNLSVVRGTHNVTATAPGFNTSTALLSVAANESVTQNFTLQSQNGTIRGTVTDQTATPLANATVAIDETGQTVTTNATGQYALEVVNGTYNLTTTLAGYDNDTAQVTVDPSETMTQNFTLVAQNGSIGGTVLNGDGDPLGNATVTIDGSGQSAVTVSNGSYTIDEVTPGTYNLTATLPNYQSDTIQTVTVPPGTAVDNVSFTLVALNGSISGTVTGPSGQALTNTTVAVNATGQTVTTDANGTYTIPSIEPGPYTLTASQPGYVSTAESVTVPPNGSVVQNVTLQAAVASVNMTITETDLNVGDVTDVTVNATYTNGTTTNVTEQVGSLTSNNTTVARPFASNMTVVANGSGSAIITASYQGVADTESVTVSEAAPPPPPPPPSGGGDGDTPTTPSDEAELLLIDASLDQERAVINESVSVEAIVENIGEQTGEFTAILRVNGSAVDEQIVSVAGGETETVSFTTAFDEVGTYDIAVNETQAGVLTVTDGVVVTDASVDLTEVAPGESVEVQGTVANNRQESVTRPIVLTVDGEQVAEQTVTIDPDSDTSVTFTHEFDDAGEYTLEVSGTHAGVVTVVDDEFGFILLLFILVLLIGLIAFLASELVPRYRDGEPPFDPDEFPRDWEDFDFQSDVVGPTKEFASTARADFTAYMAEQREAAGAALDRAAAFLQDAREDPAGTAERVRDGAAERLGAFAEWSGDQVENLRERFR